MNSYLRQKKNFSLRNFFLSLNISNLLFFVKIGKERGKEEGEGGEGLGAGAHYASVNHVNTFPPVISSKLLKNQYEVFEVFVLKKH